MTLSVNRVRFSVVSHLAVSYVYIAHCIYVGVHDVHVSSLFFSYLYVGHSVMFFLTCVVSLHFLDVGSC